MQPNENVIFNLLLETLEAITINKAQLTERLNYLVEIKVLQNKPRNGVNSFYIINNESESSESPLIQTFPDMPIIKDFSKTKLHNKDKSSDPAEKKLLQCLSKNNSMILKKVLSTFQTNRNKDIIELLQEQNKLLTEENKSKTAITEMLVESQNKLRNDRKSTEKFEVVKH